MVVPGFPVLSFPHNPHIKLIHSTTHSNDFRFRNYRAVSLIDQCTNLDQLKQIHAQMIRTGMISNPMSVSNLINASALSKFSNLEYARQVFDQIPQPDLFTWNALIRAYSSSPDPGESIAVFLRMLEQCSDSPNKFSYPFLLKAASELKASRLGRGLHGMVAKSPMASDLFILNSLVHFYGSCSDINSAYQVFLNIPEKDVVSWNSMITAFVQNDLPEEVFELFRKMELEENVKPNAVTMIGMLSACGKNMDVEFGKWVCLYIQRNGIVAKLNLNNAMLDMYVKCGSVGDAKRLFDSMPEKDVISWTTMIDAYAHSGDYDEAQRIFEVMPSQDIAAWNALISAYEQNGKPREALDVFHRLQVSNSAEPDEVTLVSTLSACAQLGAIGTGRWMHSYAKRRGLKMNCRITTALIDMYAKCGDLDEALEVFGSAKMRDVYVWSAMINGLAMHGRGREAADKFSQMVEAKIKPNAVTFTNLLCACSHAGLVDEGMGFFDEMESCYGVLPGLRHYACVVDMLGRSGLLKEASEFIEAMPIAPSASVWGALLWSCRIHCHVELAEHACARLLELDPTNHGAYVLLFNIYAETDQWDEVSRMRRLMRDLGIKKEPGGSLIEVDGTLHEFLVGDNSHPVSRDIYAKLDEIEAKLKEIGHVLNKSHVLQFVEEEEMEEQALNIHSEKLAISFGLISTAASQPIRVMKNLSVCDDCHYVAKLVSEIYGREILLRDRYRFHHFKEGKCSCIDYW